MAIGLGGSGNLTTPTPSSSGSARTFAAVARHNSAANIGVLMTQNNPAVGSIPYDVFQLRGDVSGDPIELQTEAGANTTARAGTFVADTYAAVAAGCTASGSGTATLNGVDGSTTGSWAGSGVGVATISIGAFGFSGSWFDRLNGAIANIGYYNADLTSRERKSLTVGFPPRRVRPSALKLSIPGVRTLQERAAGQTITQVGTAPTVARHPRTYGFP